MDATGKIIVALDTERDTALKIAKQISSNAAVYGFKINRSVDQEVFRKDGEPSFFEELAKLGKPVWVDIKLNDVPRTVAGRIQPYADSGMVNYITVMASGGIPMMRAAVEAGLAGKPDDLEREVKTSIIAVTVLTSLSEEEAQLIYGHLSKASVIYLAQKVVLAGIEYLVCSANEVQVIRSRLELNSLKLFVPGITPDWKEKKAPDQCRVGSPAFALINGADKLVIGSAIVNADDPLEALEKTVVEINEINK